MNFTERQRGVISRVAAGYTNREVAEELGLKEGSVKSYLYPIYNQIGVSNRVELSLWYQAHKEQLEAK